MWLDFRSRLERAILRFGEYEPETLACLRELVADGDVYWDIGANIGCHAITLGRLVPSLRAYAFEASPVVFHRLMRHCIANESPVTPICLAVGPRREYTTLSVPNMHEAGLSSLTPWPETEYHIRLPVLTDTADNIVDAGVSPPPNVIKMDVEGFEDQVLAGMRRTLASSTLRHVLFEGQRELWQDGRKDAASLLLEEAGFEVQLVSRADRTYLATRVEAKQPDESSARPLQEIR